MIITFNFLFRIAALVVFFLWWGYWQVTEKQSEKLKPKTKKVGKELLYQYLRRFILRLLELIVILQIIGLSIFPLPSSVITQFFGFLFIFIGVGIAVSGRRILGANWSHAHEYQIKKEQELVTSGIYSFIRHPIYSGLGIALVGGELVAQSYLVIVVLFGWSLGYWQARQEEKLLINHFGSAYKAYMKRTKMFIPYVL